MGYNSTIVIMNDALHCIAEDTEFGKRVYDAVTRLNTNENVYFSSKNFISAAKAVETHHADMLVPILVGCNNAYPLYKGSLPRGVLREDNVDLGLELLKELADVYGYYLRKKPVRK